MPVPCNTTGERAISPWYQPSMYRDWDYDDVSDLGSSYSRPPSSLEPGLLVSTQSSKIFTYMMDELQKFYSTELKGTCDDSKFTNSEYAVFNNPNTAPNEFRNYGSQRTTEAARSPVKEKEGNIQLSRLYINCFLLCKLHLFVVLTLAFDLPTTQCTMTTHFYVIPSPPFPSLSPSSVTCIV